MNSVNPSKNSLPKIRSFIRRQGRMTTGQQQALYGLGDKYCLNPDLEYDYAQVFGRKAPLIVEIGFGNGESLAEMASLNPDQNYLGIEVHKPGVGHLMLQIERRNLSNIRIYSHDAVEIFEHRIGDNRLAGIHLFFPDPWPKQKHHKRRIAKPEFVALMARKMQQGAYFHAATDWENYAKVMLSVFNQTAGLTNQSSDNDYCKRPKHRPLTKFEKRGIHLGHDVWDLIFRKD